MNIQELNEIAREMARVADNVAGTPAEDYVAQAFLIAELRELNGYLDRIQVLLDNHFNQNVTPLETFG